MMGAEAQHIDLRISNQRGLNQYARYHTDLTQRKTEPLIIANYVKSHRASHACSKKNFSPSRAAILDPHPGVFPGGRGWLIVIGRPYEFFPFSRSAFGAFN
jgi:hypothetical protein